MLESLWAELDRRDIRPGEGGGDEEEPVTSSWSAVNQSSQDGWDGLEDGDWRDMDDASVVTLSAVRQKRATAHSTTANPVVSSAEVRRWARNRGYAVGERGRIPENVVDAYLSAQNSRPRHEEPSR